MTRRYARLMRKATPILASGQCRLCRAQMPVQTRSAQVMVCNECRTTVLCIRCLQRHNRNSLWCSTQCRLEYAKQVTVEVS